MYNDERQLVPCSIAAPLLLGTICSQRASPVTRRHQFASDLICSTNVRAAPLARRPRARARARAPSASSPMHCLNGWKLEPISARWTWPPLLGDHCALYRALGHRHGHDQSNGCPSDEKISRAPGLRVSTLAPYSPQPTVLTACCSMPCTA